MGRVEQYRAELRRLTDWEPFLKKNSGLPGSRANLELVEAVGEEADAERADDRRAIDDLAHDRLRFRPALNRSGQAVAGWFGYAQPAPR